ncbi:MAG: glycosyltransferase [Candidatus Pacebacteria bacterium]|nr:glycosyltransferase [Candidatus Paceibacterota bacterium]
MPLLKTHKEGTVFEMYGIEPSFKIRYLFVIDFLRFGGGRIAFWLRLLNFYLSVFLYLLFHPRRGTILYTREAPLIILSYFGFRVVYECHHIFDRSNGFFWLCRKAFAIVTISQALKDSFLEQGLTTDSILVAPSGVDLSLFGRQIDKEAARRELGLPMEQHIALYTGNFTTMGEDKGIRSIIEALRQVSNVLFIAAGGSVPDIQRYRSLAQKNGVSKRVLLFGHASQERLALFQQAADVLLMPFPDTPHYRNHMSPVKMFEYMASERPIIASDLPTIREVLNETNAIIIPPDNSATLAQAVSDILRNPRKATLIASKAKYDSIAFSWEKRSERILDFIRTQEI